MSVSTNSEFSVNAIVDILSGVADSEYQRVGSVPDRVGPIQDFSHQDRVNYSNPALYIWSPVDGEISKFSADGDNYLEDQTVEVLIFTLNQALTMQYQKDILDILSDYYTDNQNRTNFYEIEPTTASDMRNESVSGRTDHYIASVEVSTNKFGDAGL